MSIRQHGARVYLITPTAEGVWSEEMLTAVSEQRQESLLALLRSAQCPSDDGVEGEDAAAAEEEAEGVRAAGLAGSELSLRQAAGLLQHLGTAELYQEMIEKIFLVHENISGT